MTAVPRALVVLGAAGVLVGAALWAAAGGQGPPPSSSRERPAAGAAVAAPEPAPPVAQAVVPAPRPPPEPPARAPAIDESIRDELTQVEERVPLGPDQRPAIAALLLARRQALDGIQARIRRAPDVPWDTAAISQEAAQADRACWDGVRRILTPSQRSAFDRHLAERNFGSYAIEIPRPPF